MILLDEQNLRSYIQQVIRQSLIVTSGFNACDGNDQDIQLSILDDQEPFSSTTIFVPEEHND